MKKLNSTQIVGVFLIALTLLAVPGLAQAVCDPGTVPAFVGSDTCILDPVTIPKYEIPLVIPPVMNNTGTADTYDIAVREFKQQILPGGIWDTVNGTSYGYPATKVWSYGPEADSTPEVAPAANSQFNYPAYTIETVADVPVSVKWRNELVAIDPNTGKPYPEGDPKRTFLPHMLPVDQTLHWANPPKDCRMGVSRTDCSGTDEAPYMGPVPIVTHVHGAHVDAHSDGYPEAWWLPKASNIDPAYATSGGIFDDATGTNPGSLGYADYLYRNDQPATTLWYHDHSLGMTRLNVYAGPAGFWLIRNGQYDKPKDTLTGLPAVLPGPAPVAGDSVVELNVPSLVPGSVDKRSGIREIPVVIQDRSFNGDGSTLFYANNRAFFEALNPAGGTEPVLDIPFINKIDGDTVSDIAPIWLPEAFFSVMVVNGVAWPNLDVAPAKYRLRLLNGCNSRFLNLSMFVVNEDGTLGAEIPFYQIGAEQGYLPNVVQIQTGSATPLPGDGTVPPLVPSLDPAQALLMGLAERADVIVDFSALADGTRVRMINTAPDAPFGGAFDEPPNPETTGQVMEFTVAQGLLKPADALTSSPLNIKPKNEPMNNGKVKIFRQVSLNEGMSEKICVVEDEVTGNLVVVPDSLPLTEETCTGGGEPFGPKEALLGTVNLTDPVAGPQGIALKWTDNTGASKPVPITLASGAILNINVTENPIEGDTEIWEIYNFTADGHPIHLHLVRFAVVDREIFTQDSPKFDPLAPNVGAVFPAEPWETGYKDTVIAYPGEITRVKASFDIPGLYVWHCHIVEHEDNEMMRPYVVSAKPKGKKK
jgi:FtsP/CotA-like multicopper oxidase with cupredoxin domain